MIVMKYSVIVVCFLAVFCVCTASWALEPDDPELVGRWLCDDGSGDTLTDSSENGNDATGAFDWDEGKFDGGIVIAAGSIDVPASDTVDDIKGGLTVAAWFRIDAVSDTGIRRNGAFLLEDQSGGEPIPDGFSFRIWTTNGLSPGVYGTTELEMGEWYHIAGTYDGEFMKLYVNGIAEEELLDSGGAGIEGEWAGDIATPGDPLQLKFASETYIGGMDEIVIFSRALDDGEMKSLAEGWEAATPVDSQSKLSATWGAIKSLQR